MIALIVCLTLSLFVNVILIYLLVRFSRRLLQFDELFQLLSHDIEVNIKYLSKLLTTPLYENNQEVKTANRNMGIISQRLDEFVSRMQELTNRKKIPEEVPPGPPPKVI